MTIKEAFGGDNILMQVTHLCNVFVSLNKGVPQRVHLGDKEYQYFAQLQCNDARYSNGLEFLSEKTSVFGLDIVRVDAPSYLWLS